MFIDVKKYVSILAKYDLTADEFLLCYLIHTENLAEIIKYCENVAYLDDDLNRHKGWSRANVKKLIEKDFIIDVNKYNSDRGEFEGYPDMFICTSSFKEIVAIDLGEAYNELVELYPPYLYIDGHRLPAKSGDFEELETVYYRGIKFNIKKHEEVMELLQYAIDNNLLNMGIEKWIRSRQWESVATLKKAKLTATFGRDV